IPVVGKLVDETEAQPYRVGKIDSRHPPRIGGMLENAVGGKREGARRKPLCAPAAVLARRAAPLARIFFVEFLRHDAERRAPQAALECVLGLGVSPRKRGPRGMGCGPQVPGLASFARGTRGGGKRNVWPV